MSSAILYVAIVAIWACVLIPRWLRRDSSSSSSPAAEEQASADVTAEATAEEEPAPAAGRPRRRRDDRQDDASERRLAPASAERRNMPREAAHRRVLASRRRLLGMLVVLAIGGGVLAGTRLAAWWVILPPSVMLLGYLIMLREAGKADAERRELAHGTDGVQEFHGAPRVRDRAVRAAAPLGRATVGPAGGPPARRAEIIDISASRGAGVKAGEEPYDQDEDARLRAVGD